MAKLSIEEIIAAVKELTVMELNDLVKAAEEEHTAAAHRHTPGVPCGRRASGRKAETL